MKFFARSLSAGFAAALLALVTLGSAANAGAVMCSPPSAAAANGARTVGGSASSVPSKTLYSLNASGCAGIAQADVGYFLSQGYSYGPAVFSVSAVGIAAQSTASNSPILPAGAFIIGIVIQETAGHAVTGGLDIGVAGASDASIVSAYTCAASCLVGVAPASILLFTFGATTTISGKPAAQQIFINAHTNWSDAAVVNVTIFYSLYTPT